MRRFPWVSVALLIDLGLLALLSYRVTDDDSAVAVAVGDEMDGPYMLLGAVASAAALVIGALGVWARAPATLPTALGIVGAGAFAASWIANLAYTAEGGFTLFRLGFVIAFTAVLVAFAASARRMAMAPPE